MTAEVRMIPPARPQGEYRSATREGTPASAPLSLLPLRLDNVEFAAGGHRIIKGVSTTILRGPRTILLGPNGAGKSVFLRLIHGLLTPTAGTIRWNAPELPGGPRRQAMVFQRPVLLRRTALGNVTYALKLAGVPSGAREDRAFDALCKVGLYREADRAARVLSGGEQQRLALARALARDPEVLFLDEPTASLDPAATKAVEDIIRAVAQSGVKIVMATHDLGQARRLAGEIVFLLRGTVHACAETERFFTAPATPEAAAFIRGDLVI